MPHEEIIPIATLSTPISSLKALIVDHGNGNVLAKDITSGFIGGSAFVGSFTYSGFSDTNPASVWFYTGTYSGNVGAAFNFSLFSPAPSLSPGASSIPLSNGLSGPSSVTLTFRDSNSNPVPGVDFSIQGIGSSRSNASGVAAFGLLDGTYTVVAKPTNGILFGNTTLIVSGATALTIQGTSQAVSPEPFGGAGSVLLNRKRSELEVYNDLDTKQVAVMIVVRDHVEQLGARLRQLEYCEKTFEEAKAADNQWNAEPVDLIIEDDNWVLDRVVNYIVRNRMSRSALGETFAWSDRLRRGMPESLSAWLSNIESLAKIHLRLKGVIIRNDPALQVIEEYDAEDTTFYEDPPYLHSTRTATASYGRFEMSDEQHTELLAAGLRCKARVAISGYPSPLYDGMLSAWTRHTFHRFNNAGQGKKKHPRTEVVWINR